MLFVFPRRGFRSRLPSTGTQSFRKALLFTTTTILSQLVGTRQPYAAGAISVTVVQTVKGEANAQPHYVANRAPLVPSAFIKLPIGSITPKGWLRHQLDLEKNGMIGRLKEISPWLKFETSAWASKEGKGERGWEEMPYWLKGYGDLGYVLKDDAIIAEARRWIEAVLVSQRADGWFGPRDLLAGLKGKPDLWPHMVILNILQSVPGLSLLPAQCLSRLAVLRRGTLARDRRQGLVRLPLRRQRSHGESR